jgi:hypothetical protein
MVDEIGDNNGSKRKQHENVCDSLYAQLETPNKRKENDESRNNNGGLSR